MAREQAFILGKLGTYLGLKLQEMKKTQPRDTVLEMEIWRRAQALREHGFCYGFSIIHSAMELAGKKDWWYSVCAAIARWDGKPESLKKLYSLPQSEDTKPVSLEQIFDRAISYIVFNHAIPTSHTHAFSRPSAHLSPVKQDDFLAPDGHFELLAGNLIFKVSHREKISGHFEHDELVAFLNRPKTKFDVANGICLIGTSDHSCSLSYGQNNHRSGWFYYDPNYEDGKAKFFANIHELVTEIQETLGEEEEIDIELAQLSPTALKSQKLYLDEETLEKKTEVSADQGNQQSQELEDEKQLPHPAKDVKTVPKPTYLTVMKLPAPPPTPVLSVTVDSKMSKPAQHSGSGKVAGDYFTLNHLLQRKGEGECMKYIQTKYRTSEEMQGLIHYAGLMRNTRLQELCKHKYIPDQHKLSDGIATYTI